METRNFTGKLRAPDGKSAEMEIEIQISKMRGMKTGHGVLQVPLSMAGSLMDGKLTFETHEGETLDLLVTRHQVAQGTAIFRTSGRVPEQSHAP